jgi:hypothetical protein
VRDVKVEGCVPLPCMHEKFTFRGHTTGKRFFCESYRRLSVESDVCLKVSRENELIVRD